MRSVGKLAYYQNKGGRELVVRLRHYFPVIKKWAITEPNDDRPLEVTNPDFPLWTVYEDELIDLDRHP